MVADRPIRLRVICAACAFLLAAGTVACAPDTQEAVPATPDDSVEQLLQLRAERSTDASAYAEYVEDVALATELARSAELELEREATASPTPRWEPPYVSREDGDTADVVVVWVADEGYPDWPAATVFVMHRVDERWRAIDAQPVDSDIPPPTE